MKSRLGLLAYWLLLFVLILFLSSTEITGAQEVGPYRLYLPVTHGAQPNKLGIDGCPRTAEQALTFGASWCHSWTPCLDVPAGVEFVPMIWSDAHNADVICGTSRYIAQYNEADWHQQAGATMTVASTAVGILDLEGRYPSHLFVAPTMSMYGRQFLVNVRNEFIRISPDHQPPRWQALSFNCHQDTVQNCTERLNWYLARAAEWGVPEVWASEISFKTEAEAHEFMALLDRIPQVARYGIYVTIQDCHDGTWNCKRDGNPSLLNADGTLTPVGWWYARPFWKVF